VKRSTLILYILRSAFLFEMVLCITWVSDWMDVRHSVRFRCGEWPESMVESFCDAEHQRLI